MISGKNKGKEGTVLSVNRKKNTVIVEGVNMRDMLIARATPDRKAEREDRPLPIHVSNVSLIDPKTNTASRTKFAFLESGEKVRVSKKSGMTIPRPPIEVPTYSKNDLTDTPLDIAEMITYVAMDYGALREEIFREREAELEALEYESGQEISGLGKA